MSLSTEILIELGFKKMYINENIMYQYDIIGVEPLYLEKIHKEKEFYMVYKKNEYDDFKECGHCDDLASLFQMMMKINHTDSMKLGKELKQQEIKSVLGLS